MSEAVIEMNPGQCMSDLKLDLSLVYSNFHRQAVRYFDEGDAEGLLAPMVSAARLTFVFNNRYALRGRGIYAKALLFAMTSMNTSHWERRTIDHLLNDIVDRDELRKAGDELPGSGPFTVYRGVSGRGRNRRVRGLSWTDSLDIACYFASVRYDHLPVGSVYSATVGTDEVYAYLNENEGRGEQEFIARPIAYRRMALQNREILERGYRYSAEILKSNMALAGATG